jgi:hypothetical protein
LARHAIADWGELEPTDVAEKLSARTLKPWRSRIPNLQESHGERVGDQPNCKPFARSAQQSLRPSPMRNYGHE